VTVTVDWTGMVHRRRLAWTRTATRRRHCLHRRRIVPVGTSAVTVVATEGLMATHRRRLHRRLLRRPRLAGTLIGTPHRHRRPHCRIVRLGAREAPVAATEGSTAMHRPHRRLLRRRIVRLGTSEVPVMATEDRTATRYRRPHRRLTSAIGTIHRAGYSRAVALPTALRRTVSSPADSCRRYAAQRWGRAEMMDTVSWPGVSDDAPGHDPCAGGIAMRVLVIEDEPELLRVVARALREDGYAVDEAADGDEGLFRATSWDYDVVVLDLMLPKRNGWQVLAELRRERETPVLILTARDGVNDRVRGLDAGADDYLVKPFELTELRARLRALIRRAAGQAHPVISVGRIAVDTRARTVHCDGQAVLLTGREYALVELLALRRGQLVTRTQIYEHLFDENDDTLSNLVEVHVSNIRKKLGKDFITTRRGQGYVIDA